ncbi:MAG: HlyD family type I secretion periplasmic adaptor subunit [Proteobacteria bacterium]|nr:HlyD family type I secretion periplasmic adaptor subunit [Pseudomonadota bacterium]MBU1231774.1 HlyD family type I secretion periplasmic adaptor subunit [Pseudomonadota bacterium]MBU1417168.1 HlyD family type I secretion periplasmic adaptor subunit [Pseudomonadota bacterium]MBU1456244.1 HlyD family type I secretion periplasmic adaptor subunit [Pseudomonadota bacterium]
MEKKSTGIFDQESSVSTDLATDIRTTILIQSPRGGRSIIWMTLLLLVLALYWASVSEIEELTRGLGKVVPSRQIQVVQNLEGGILAELHVQIGDIVKKGQLLMRLDETRFNAPLEDNHFNYLALKAKVARLVAETKGVKIAIPEEIAEESKEIVDRELALYNSRQEELNTTLEILQETVNQRQQEVEELRAKLTELVRTYRLLAREIELTRPLIAEGAVSQVELLRLERQASQMKGSIEATKLAIPRVESKHKEALQEMREERLLFANKAKVELNEVYPRLQGLSSTSKALADRLDRTAIRSPVYGTINQILVNTEGGVIQPGMDLIEIVPLEDTLLVEARIQPADIAFLRPRQKAMVKFTAYDFTIYGGLEAELEHISADSLVDEQGNSYYLVKVRTKQNYIKGKNGELPIMPGMVASVDIMTGKKTILSYLLKPILRVQQTALRER